MKKKIKDPDQPVGKLTKIADFLPPPHLLQLSEPNTKITLAVDNETLGFFKNNAKNSGMKYQKMMREVLKLYAKKYKKVI